MGWLKHRKELRDAHDDLLYILKLDDNTDSLDMWSVSKITRETAITARKFIGRNKLKHSDIGKVVYAILAKYSDAETRLMIFIRNFDHAVELGWKYAPTASTFILEAIDEHRESKYSKDYTPLTAEQESALLILEDSQWNQSSTYSSNQMTRRYTCTAPVYDVVLKRPQDVAEIIEVARSANISHVAQLIALLDGEVPSAIGSGVL